MTDFQASKSFSDNKEYKCITLEYGLEALLVSSLSLTTKNVPIVSKAAAAMCVSIGSFSDPEYCCGLAHFVEHMVFMGSEKYPVENEYDSFVSAHGGYCNAFTDSQFTCYTFDILSEYFAEALDIFANCFISPLLSINSADREVSAIDSEYTIALNHDDNRLQQVLSFSSNEDHVMKKFGWGNKLSLTNAFPSGDAKVEDLLRVFHHNYYRPANMKLVVIGPFSLEYLGDIVSNSFGQWRGPLNEKSMRTVEVTNHRLHSLEEYRSHISKQGLPYNFNNILYKRVIAVKNHSWLHLYWQLPPAMQLYRSKPDEYLAHLLGHECSGSLFSCLKSLGLASQLIAGVSEKSRFLRCKGDISPAFLLCLTRSHRTIEALTFSPARTPLYSVHVGPGGGRLLQQFDRFNLRRGG